MDKEQLETLLSSFKEELLTTVKSEMTSTLEQVNKANGGLAASLTKEFKKQLSSLEGISSGVVSSDESVEPEKEVKESPGTERLTLKALKKEIESLRQANEQKESQLLLTQRDSKIAEVFSKDSVNFPDRAKKAFLLEYGESLKNEDGTWYVAQGEEVTSLEDAANNFLSTDFGSSFIKPSKGRGMSLKPANTVTPPGGKAGEPTLNTTLFAVEE